MARNNTAEPRRVVLQRQLALVLRDIAASAGRIAKQQEIIAKLDKSGHYSSEAVSKLATFAKEHALNVATHDHALYHVRDDRSLDDKGRQRRGSRALEGNSRERSKRRAELCSESRNLR